MNNGPNYTTAERPVLSWSERIEKSDTFLSRTCRIYNHLSTQGGENSVCPCGRFVRRHSFEGHCLQPRDELAPTDLGYNEGYAAHVKLNTWGIHSSGCKYLRCANDTDIKNIYDLIVADCKGRKPPFIISVYGGAKYFGLTDKLEKEFMRGIIHTATTANAWIVTAGINNGVSKLVGEGISHYRLLKEYPKKVICIGLTMWGTVGEYTRSQLCQHLANQNNDAEIVPTDISNTTNQVNLRNRLPKQTLADTNEDNKNMLEENHTHCILLDSGRMYDYLTDKQRSKLVTVACSDPENPCYGVTIIVEGGTGTLEVLENDINNKRPIVLIQGSGRISDVIANLIDLTTNVGQNQQRDPTEKEIENAFLDKFPNYPPDKLSDEIKHIAKLLKSENRCYLNVFRLDRDINVAETIFKAIFKAINYKKQQNPLDNTSQDYNLKLARLALKWDYLHGAKQILESPSYTDQNEQQTILQDIKETRHLFRESLELNRPEFVDYFLRAGFDARNLSHSHYMDEQQKVIVKLYKKRLHPKSENHSYRVIPVFGSPDIESIGSLNKKLQNLLGSFVHPIYSGSNRDQLVRVSVDEPVQSRFRGSFTSSLTEEQNDETRPIINTTLQLALMFWPERSYNEQDILRDLFLWSVFMDLPQMAKVLLAHLKPRICGALIASAIFKQYAIGSSNIDFKQKMQIQANEFELYAAKCVDQCYDYNEGTSCELLLRQIPLFGKITCMQVAISSGSTKFLETACFDQALNEAWCGKLALSYHRLESKPRLFISILLFGLPAPYLLKYRQEDNPSDNEKKITFELSPRGINYWSEKKTNASSKWSTSWKKFNYFHQSPMVRMCYHFISYIWFLLVFSYMMLYHFDLPSGISGVHWTEVYVFITITAMLTEDLRRRIFEYNNRMLETRGSRGSSILTFCTYIFYIAPYPLFYLGIAIRYGSGNNRNALSVARILLAFDLELWYLRSLKFVIALKYLGPKLFMLKNMLRDTFAFVYMIFIAIAAYGVVSRALVLYKQVPFTGRGIFEQIFYHPYWFIYGEIADNDMLDNIIHNDTSTNKVEATATHVLLAFHMLFINILLLNLLIAVFTDTIGKVQQNTEFYWRYQRYAFVREYFEQSYVAYPPLNIFSLFELLIYGCKRIKKEYRHRNRGNGASNVKRTQVESTSLLSIFKLIPVHGQSLDEYWDMFESVATHSYARAALEKKKQLCSHIGNRDLLGGISDEQGTISTNFDLSSTNVDENRPSNSDGQNTTDYIKEELCGLRSTLTDIQTQLNQVKSNSDTQNTTDYLKEELSGLRSSVTDIQSQLNQIKSNSNTQNTTDYLKEELSGFRSTLTDMQTQFNQKNATVENLHTTMEQMVQSIKRMMNERTAVNISNEAQPTN